MALFDDLIIALNTHPKRGADGGFQYQVTPCLDFIRKTWPWPSSLIPWCLFRRPLWLKIFRTNALRNAPASNGFAISKWQKWVCKHKNKHRCRLAGDLPRPWMVRYGPPKSTAQLASGLVVIWRPICGNGAISAGLAGLWNASHIHGLHCPLVWPLHRHG